MCQTFSELFYLNHHFLCEWVTVWRIYEFIQKIRSLKRAFTICTEKTNAVLYRPALYFNRKYCLYLLHPPCIFIVYLTVFMCKNTKKNVLPWTVQAKYSSDIFIQIILVYYQIVRQRGACIHMINLWYIILVFSLNLTACL